MDETVFKCLQEAIVKASTFNSGVQAEPAIVLWPDADRQWEPAFRQLRELWPHLLALGDYDPKQRMGPAIWLKCMIARTLPEAEWAEGEIPIVYLPGVSRLDLRAVESCPRFLQPLAELQYRGTIWSQVNGKDWTVNAFLTSKRGGLELDIAQDRSTQTALLRALQPILETRVGDLKGRRLDASDLDALLSPDPVRDVLVWLDQPDAMGNEWSGPRWEAFVAHSRQIYKFDPISDGPLAGAEKLAASEGAWVAVWQRFSESTTGYPGLVEQLYSAAPIDLLSDESHYPKVNADKENALREALLALVLVSPGKARKKLQNLERHHGLRRQWVWSERGDAPLARALKSLSELCLAVESASDATEPEALGKHYAQESWKIDWHALRTLSSVKTQADLNAVVAALKSVYIPWLTESAISFQQAVKVHGYPGMGFQIGETKVSYQAGGECILFVDGLRFDVGKELVERLSSSGYTCNFEQAWAPFPPVTASGKVWVSPVIEQVTGRATNQDFEPSLKDQDKPLTTHYFRKLLQDAGWQVLRGFDSGDPSGKAWAEFGDLDHFGHEHGLRLAHEIDRVCCDLLERIQSLFDAGWKQLTVVTDHGWLLVPGKMPKVNLDKFLTETRWGRCALMKPGAHAPGLVLGWGWCPEVAVASAPGISSHRAGLEYAHGGLSLQECIVPVINIQSGPGSATTIRAVITDVKWIGLRCRIAIDITDSGFQADLRTKANDATTSFCGGGKSVTNGKASLAVLDDEHEGSAAMVVVLDAEGRVVVKQNTVIGG
ncbi:MAG: BREX-1 system phosphatase PglZ type B [bacterium]|nr:BREX-1 system phosphatase PglZ type B [bacterium]